jgi:hypothetical protein
MQLGGLAGVTALTATLDQQPPAKAVAGPWSGSIPERP